MRLATVFMGSPPFAVPSLEALRARTDVRAVVTQPDRPRGRGLALEAPAVKLAAERAGLPVLQPLKLKTGDFAEQLRRLAPDLIVVVAYGRILPPLVLAAARLGCVNVHASLLPRWRGAAPIQWAIISGDRATGVTLMQLDAGLDTGPILAQRALALPEDATSGDLHARLALLGAELLGDSLEPLARGALIPHPQDDAGATLAPILEKAHGRIDFGRGAVAVRDLVRGVDPWPGAFTTLGGEPLRVWRARVVAGAGPPGVVLGAAPEGLRVACGEGAVALGELQLPGRKRLPAAAFLAGRPLAPGERLGGA